MSKKEAVMNNKTGTRKGMPFNLEKHVNYADGSVVSKTLLKKDVGNITLFAFDSGQGLSEHTAPFDAVVYILDGRARITIGEKTRKVNSGEMLIMPANVPHSLSAEEKFKMLLVMIRGE
jgi:quercetin dioxygenase-like cupin family protein